MAARRGGPAGRCPREAPARGSVRAEAPARPKRSPGGRRGPAAARPGLWRHAGTERGREAIVRRAEAGPGSCRGSAAPGPARLGLPLCGPGPARPRFVRAERRGQGQRGPAGPGGGPGPARSAQALREAVGGGTGPGCPAAPPRLQPGGGRAACPAACRASLTAGGPRLLPLRPSGLTLAWKQ